MNFVWLVLFILNATLAGGNFYVYFTGAGDEFNLVIGLVNCFFAGMSGVLMVED